MSEAPLVSVIIATYNQESIVGRAIGSALAQETNFPVEIVVGEDCSTDRTREVVCAWGARYPDRVKVICNPQNLFIQSNMVSMMKASRGRYIAWLDGDDYWTHPGKLRKQIEFLEQNPGYTASTHNVRIVTVDGALTNACYPDVPAGSKVVEDLINEDFVASLSIVFRNTLTKRIPDWYYTDALTDWPLWMVLIQDGPFMHFQDVMADYVMHPKSTWSSRGEVYRCEMEVEFYRRCRTLLPPRHLRLLRSCEGVRRQRQSRAYIAEGNWPAARKSAWLGATVPDWRDNARDKLRILAEAYTPKMIGLARAIRGIG